MSLLFGTKKGSSFNAKLVPWLGRDSGGRRSRTLRQVRRNMLSASLAFAFRWLQRSINISMKQLGAKRMSYMWSYSTGMILPRLLRENPVYEGELFRFLLGGLAPS